MPPSAPDPAVLTPFLRSASEDRQASRPPTGVPPLAPGIAVDQLDDGVWVSVDDSRAVNVSDLRRLARHDLCARRLAGVLAEEVVDVRPGYTEVADRPPDGVEDHEIGTALVGGGTHRRLVSVAACGRAVGARGHLPPQPSARRRTRAPSRRRSRGRR